MQSSYTAEKKRKLQEVLTIDYMSPEESVYEPDNSDEESVPKLEKLVRHKFEWRSDELDREFQSLDRKADRARSQRAKRMMVPREEGDSIYNEATGGLDYTCSKWRTTRATFIPQSEVVT